MHPGFLTMLKKLDKNKVVTTFSTNGTLITDSLAQEISTLRYLGNINISIDSTDADGYSRLRGGNFSKAIDGVKFLSNYRSRLTVSSILLKSNIDDLMHLPEILSKTRVKKWVIQSLKSNDADVNKDNVFYTDEIAEKLNKITLNAKKHNVSLSLYQRERVQADITTTAKNNFISAAEQGMTKNCVIPWVWPFINKDGLVFPCCYLSDKADAIMGDIKEEPLEAIWNGPKFEEYRKSLMLLDGRSMPAHCTTCTETETTKHHRAAENTISWQLYIKKFELHQTLRKFRYRTLWKI
jgi:MoaA/NifB/PqqE/SkfB family radical SAM enzyme